MVLGNTQIMKTLEVNKISSGSKELFFEQKAPIWDSRIRTSDYIALERIFRLYPLYSTNKIIDVGSGSGIAIPYYLRAGISHLYSVEQCGAMVDILRGKFPSLKIFHQSYLEPLDFNHDIDKIVIYNTFPHFDDFEPVFKNSARYLKKGGMLIIAHSMDRRSLNLHHKKHRAVSEDILPGDDFFRIKFAEYGFTKWRTVDRDWFYTAAELS